MADVLSCMNLRLAAAPLWRACNLIVVACNTCQVLRHSKPLTAAWMRIAAPCKCCKTALSLLSCVCLHRGSCSHEAQVCLHTDLNC